MNRRQLLTTAGVALSASYSGCIGNVDGEDPVTPSSGTTSEVSDDCGPAEYSLSELFTTEIGDPSSCFTGATPSVAIENERDETLTVTVNIDNEDAITETYTLASDERIVERSAFEAEAGVTGIVSIDGEVEQRVEWPDRSCYRHGIALTPDGVEIGLVEPLRGPGDTQHDCYAGDDALVSVHSVGESRTITVKIVDLCAETASTQTVDLSADESERVTGALTTGGMYDVTVDVKDGDSQTYEFYEGCWGVEISIEEDGEVRLHEMAID